MKDTGTQRVTLNVFSTQFKKILQANLFVWILSYVGGACTCAVVSSVDFNITTTNTSTICHKCVQVLWSTVVTYQHGRGVLDAQSIWNVDIFEESWTKKCWVFYLNTLYISLNHPLSLFSILLLNICSPNSMASIASMAVLPANLNPSLVPLQTLQPQCITSLCTFLCMYIFIPLPFINILFHVSWEVYGH